MSREGFICLKDLLSACSCPCPCPRKIKKNQERPRHNKHQGRFTKKIKELLRKLYWFQFCMHLECALNCTALHTAFFFKYYFTAEKIFYHYTACTVLKILHNGHYKMAEKVHINPCLLFWPPDARSSFLVQHKLSKECKTSSVFGNLIISRISIWHNMTRPESEC